MSYARISCPDAERLSLRSVPSPARWSLLGACVTGPVIFRHHAASRMVMLVHCGVPVFRGVPCCGKIAEDTACARIRAHIVALFLLLGRIIRDNPLSVRIHERTQMRTGLTGRVRFFVRHPADRAGHHHHHHHHRSSSIRARRPEAPTPGSAPKPEARSPETPNPEAPKPRSPKPRSPKPRSPKPLRPHPAPTRAASTSSAPAAAPAETGRSRPPAGNLERPQRGRPGPETRQVVERTGQVHGA